MSKKASKFVTKDSGVRIHFASGAKRDTQEGKPRYDLIPPLALKRIAELYARGAVKYNEHNWSLGISQQRMFSSAFRHLMQFALGEKDEDHLAAVCFNVMGIMHFQETGRKDLDDMHDWKKK